MNVNSRHLPYNFCKNINSSVFTITNYKNTLYPSKHDNILIQSCYFTTDTNYYTIYFYLIKYTRLHTSCIKMNYYIIDTLLRNF